MSSHNQICLDLPGVPLGSLGGIHREKIIQNINYVVFYCWLGVDRHAQSHQDMPRPTRGELDWSRVGMTTLEMI